MPILFRGPVHVHYRQFYVQSRTDDSYDDMDQASGGQANGLCGAAIRSSLAASARTGRLPGPVLRKWSGRGAGTGHQDGRSAGR